MKRFIKNNLKFIFGFIAGGIICGGVGIYAASLSFASGDVAHKKTDGTTTTVKNAINELYKKSEESGAGKVKFKVTTFIKEANQPTSVNQVNYVTIDSKNLTIDPSTISFSWSLNGGYYGGSVTISDVSTVE